VHPARVDWSRRRRLPPLAALRDTFVFEQLLVCPENPARRPLKCSAVDLVDLLVRQEADRHRRRLLEPQFETGCRPERKGRLLGEPFLAPDRPAGTVDAGVGQGNIADHDGPYSSSSTLHVPALSCSLKPDSKMTFPICSSTAVGPAERNSGTSPWRTTAAACRSATYSQLVELQILRSLPGQAPLGDQVWDERRSVVGSGDNRDWARWFLLRKRRPPD
jgi:hypothetical protein